MRLISWISPTCLASALALNCMVALAAEHSNFLIPANEATAVGKQLPPLAVEHWIQFDDAAIGKAIEDGKPLPADSVYLLEFWATWCMPCVAGMNDISQFSEEMRDKGVRVLAITDEPLAKVVSFLRSEGRGGTTQFDRFRTTVASDTDGSVMASMVPEEFRRFRPFAIVIGKDGIVEWMGQDKTKAKRVVDEVLQGTWDRELFRTQWLASLADQRERERIQRDEDWTAAKNVYWNDAQFLSSIAFRIGFNFGGTVKNADLSIAEVFARRAVELTNRSSAYQLSVLAQVLHKSGKPKDAAETQRLAIQQLTQGEENAFYESNLAVYERAASETR